MRIVLIRAIPDFMPFFISWPGRGTMAIVITIAIRSGARIKERERTPQNTSTAAARETSPR